MKKSIITIFVLIVIIFIVWLLLSRKDNALVISPIDQQSVVNTLPATTDQLKLYRGKDFTLSYPLGYQVQEQYVYQALGPGKDIFGVAFVIPESMQSGTNLSSDTKLSVESLPNIKTCNANSFMMDGATVNTQTDNGLTYSVGNTSGAGAGNRYDETVYAFKDSKAICYGIRYYIHYGAIENYPEGTTTSFDRTKLLNDFDAMRRSLLFI